MKKITLALLVAALYGCGGGGDGSTASSSSSGTSPSSISPSESAATEAEVKQTLEDNTNGQAAATELANTFVLNEVNFNVGPVAASASQKEQAEEVSQFANAELHRFINSKKANGELSTKATQTEMCKTGGSVTVEEIEQNPEEVEVGDKLLITFSECKESDAEGNSIITNGTFRIEVTSVSAPNAVPAVIKLSQREQIKITLMSSDGAKFVLASDDRFNLEFSDSAPDNASDFIFTQQITGTPNSSFDSSSVEFTPAPNDTSNSAGSLAQVFSNITAVNKETFANSALTSVEEGVNFDFLGNVLLREGDAPVLRFDYRTLKNFVFNRNGEVLKGQTRISFSPTVYVEFTVEEVSSGVPSTLRVDIETNPDNMVRERTFNLTVNSGSINR